jgi:GAF domain-containing protein
MVPRLPRWDEPHGGQEPIDIEGRQRAVDRIGLCEPTIQREFEQLVEFARLAYGTRHASLAVFHEGEVRFPVARGFEGVPLPEARTVSTYAAASLTGLLVGDAQQHPRLGSCEAVETGRVRFYAGYRVESPDGHPVAVLSVSDPAPRAADDTDLTMLRNYAMATQRRLWSLCARRAVAR